MTPVRLSNSAFINKVVSSAYSYVKDMENSSFKEKILIKINRNQNLNHDISLDCVMTNMLD